MTTAGTRDLVKRLTKVLWSPMANDTTRERWLELALADMPWLRGKLDTSGTPEEATSAILLELLAHQGEAGRRAVLNLIEEYGERQSTVSAPDAAMGGEAETLAALRAAVMALHAPPGDTRVPEDLPAPLAELLAAAMGDEEKVAATPEVIAAARAYPPADWTAYRLARLAEWLRPRYELDRRFVRLDVLLDQGEAATAGRWLGGKDTFGDLGEALEALADFPAVVLLGRPGAGKSTLLRHLELTTVRAGLRGEANVVPVFVPLNECRPERPGDPAPEPEAWVEAYWENCFGRLPPLSDVIAAGQCLFLMDGVNELSTLRLRSTAQCWRAGDSSWCDG